MSSPSVTAPASALSGYRPALDGVRAGAVLAVIAYHLDQFPSGFLGVDVFFVLSGYLITTLLLNELAGTGTLRLSDFWARRARRLLPALLLLLAVAAVATGLSALAISLSARRGDILSTLFYFANWHFIATGQSYFATYAGTSPLLHAWSLAIEEQFYLLWPLVLLGLVWLLRRRRRVLPWVLLTGAALSLGEMAILFNPANPNRVYLGTDTRSQTLLVGAALAAFVHTRPGILSSHRARSLAARAWPLVAVALVVTAVVVNDQTVAYYRGGAALFALLVAVGLWILEVAPHARPAAVLSIPPLRWTGRISYGLYLWHWPLIVWLGQWYSLTGNLSGRSLKLLELALTFAIATASFYLVENPIRRGRAPWLGRSGIRLAVVVAVSMAVIVAITLRTTSLSPSLAAEINDHGSTQCSNSSPSVAGFSWCSWTLPANSSSLSIATVGDSSSTALTPGLISLAAKRGWRYIQGGQNGCSLLPLVLPIPSDKPPFAIRKLCVRFVPVVLSRIATTFHPAVWIVSDRFALDALALPDGQVLAPGNPRRDALIEASLRGVMRRLTERGAEVVLIATPPRGQPVDCATHKPPPGICGSASFTTDNREAAGLNRLYRSVAAEFPGKVVYVTVEDVLCPRRTCPAFVDGVLARYDGVHYTATFSRKIAPIIIARARRAGISFAGA